MVDLLLTMTMAPLMAGVALEVSPLAHETEEGRQAPGY
jgi:hypothetical protein